LKTNVFYEQLEKSITHTMEASAATAAGPSSGGPIKGQRPQRCVAKKVFTFFTFLIMYKIGLGAVFRNLSQLCVVLT
jgi:hypothetical protein